MLHYQTAAPASSLMPSLLMRKETLSSSKVWDVCFFTNNDFIFGVVIIYYPLEPGFGSNIREPKSTKRCGFNTKARNTTIGGTDTGNRWNTFTSQQKHMEITRLTCSRHIYNSYMSTRKLGDSLVNAVLTETQH